MKTGSDSFGGKFKLLVPQLDSIRSRVYWQHGMTQKEGDGGYYCSVPLLHSADVSFVCSVPDCSESKRRGTAVLTHSFPRLPTHSLTVASRVPVNWESTGLASFCCAGCLGFIFQGTEKMLAWSTAASPPGYRSRVTGWPRCLSR